jgi:hypothetical protein
VRGQRSQRTQCPGWPITMADGYVHSLLLPPDSRLDLLLLMGSDMKPTYSAQSNNSLVRLTYDKFVTPHHKPRH